MKKRTSKVPAAMSYDTWHSTFKPKLNKLSGATMSWGGLLFETYGIEDAHIRKLANEAPKTVWTLVDTDEGLRIAAGWHYVNRVGYFVTEVPWTNEDMDIHAED